MQDNLEKQFSQAFELFDESSIIQDLHEKIKPKSYFHRNKKWMLFLTGVSWVMNLVSVVTAGYSIYYVTKFLTGIEWLGVAIGLVVIGVVEVTKRKSSHEFWQVFFFKKRIAKGWLFLSLLLFAFSLLASSFGTKKGGNELAPDVELLKADSLATHYNAEISMLEAKNADLRANKDHTGTTFYKLSDGISANEVIIAEYRKRLLAQDKKLEGKNELLTTEYQDEVVATTWVLVSIVILCEIIFECCVAYVWYFYFRSYVEKGITEGWLSCIEDITQNHNIDAASLKNTLKTAVKEREHVDANREQRTKEREQASKRREHVAERVSDNVVDDRFTIEHRYTKDGEEIVVRYAKGTIDSRVRQYSDKLKEAEEASAHDRVVANLTEKLDYWIGKQIELMEKMDIAEAA